MPDAPVSFNGTMRRRALHRAEPMGVRHALSTLWLWLRMAALMLTALLSLLVMVACLWATFQVALMLIHFVMGLF